MEVNPSENFEYPRKKKKNEDLWARAKLKKQRYAPPGPPKSISCQHNKKGSAYFCREIRRDDLLIFHNKFYSSGKISELKTRQDSFLLKYTDAATPKKTRIVNNRKGPKTISITYFIYAKTKKKKIRVCQKAFLDTLRLSKNRVTAVVSRHVQTGEMPKETRGGDRKHKMYENKRNSVVNFIKKFKVIESHYFRSKTHNRLYLNSDLNINVMWRMFDIQTTDQSLKVKPSYFRHVFRTMFNIGFGSPRTDECSTCISLGERIKNEKGQKNKELLMAEKRCHKLKAQAFYLFLKEKRDDLLIISFDCQKNQVLPRVPDQSAYYSRQLYKYNLTIVVGSSKCKQTKENVFTYEWNETEYNKGPNEICSAVYHCLTNMNIPETISIIRLASDGCGAQNKNFYMMGMLSVWFLKYAPKNVTSIEYIFPVVGHSFLPSDRIFAHIEKKIKMSDVIIDPQEYTKLFSEFATVRSLVGINYDWKAAIAKVVRPPGQWHFQFNPCKRFIFQRNARAANIHIRGEVHYRTDIGSYKSVCKKTKKINDIELPNSIPVGVKVSLLKIRDISALLAKHFGENWRDLQSLSYYVGVISSQEEERNQQDIIEDEDAILNQEITGENIGLEGNHPEEHCENVDEVNNLVV